MRWGVITFPGSCDDQDVFDDDGRDAVSQLAERMAALLETASLSVCVPADRRPRQAALPLLA